MQVGYPLHKLQHSLNLSVPCTPFPPVSALLFAGPQPPTRQRLPALPETKETGGSPGRLPAHQTPPTISASAHPLSLVPCLPSHHTPVPNWDGDSLHYQRPSKIEVQVSYLPSKFPNSLNVSPFLYWITSPVQCLTIPLPDHQSCALLVVSPQPSTGAEMPSYTRDQGDCEKPRSH